MLTRAARRGVEGVPLVGDLPFGSYEPSDEIAVATARRFVDEAGCDAVKLEGAGAMLSRVRAIIAAGIPVIGHVGLLPQSVVTPDGYRAQGRDAEQALAHHRRCRGARGRGLRGAHRRGGAGGRRRAAHGARRRSR